MIGKTYGTNLYEIPGIYVSFIEQKYKKKIWLIPEKGMYIIPGYSVEIRLLACADYNV